MTTLGRPESFRTAYQAVLHDLAAMTAERDALKDENAALLAQWDRWEADLHRWAKEHTRLDVAEAENDALLAKTKAMDEVEHAHGMRIMALKEEVARLNRAIVEHAGRNEYVGSCSWCEAYTVNDGDVLKHKFGCILIKARKQKET